MELKEFIKQTLVQITNGVVEAQESIKNTGCYINPEGFHTGEQVKPGFNKEYRHVQKIKLSIAVTVEENNETGKGVGVSSILVAGISTKNNNTNTSTNHIEFEIPISLPVMDIDKK